MNRNEFINTLDRYLSGLPADEKQDILYDYHEHFNIGLEQGKTEDQISEALGDPKTIGRQFKAGHAVKRAEENKSAGNIFRAIFAALGLGFFNLIFILWIFIAAAGIIAGLAAAALGTTIGGIAILIVSIFQPVLPGTFNYTINPGAGIFLSVGLIAFGLLFSIGVYYLVKIFYNITVKYLKMNLSIIIKK